MDRRRITVFDLIALSLATIGAINWGLSGAANFNVVRRIFGRGSIFERIVYIVVGLAGLDLAWLTARLFSSYSSRQMGPVPGMMERAGRTMEQVGPRVQQAGQNVQQGGMGQPGMYSQHR